jgi:hypothetical protein
MDSFHAALKQWIEMDVPIKLIFVCVLCKYNQNLYLQTTVTSWKCHFVVLYVSNIKLMKTRGGVFEIERL